MATYSAFFSSGLLAPCIARCTTPVLPSSPMAISASHVDPVDRQMSLTPTPPGQTSLCPKAPEAHTNSERPKMRRRRSSINIGASPMALIKSPIRNAGAALQRAGFISPTRHRTASVSMNEASENTSLFGRLRSGSMGGIANPSRRLRRVIHHEKPLAPPPSAPLPAPPASPTPRRRSSLLPSVILAPMPRQPFTTKSSRADSVGNLFSPTLLSPDYTPNMPFKLSPSLSGSRDDAIDEAMRED